MPEGQETSPGRGLQEDPWAGGGTCKCGGGLQMTSLEFQKCQTPEKGQRERMAVRGWPLRTGEGGNPDATSLGSWGLLRQ